MIALGGTGSLFPRHGFTEWDYGTSLSGKEGRDVRDDVGKVLRVEEDVKGGIKRKSQRWSLLFSVMIVSDKVSNLISYGTLQFMLKELKCHRERMGLPIQYGVSKVKSYIVF